MNAMRPIHPGEVLKEELTEINMSANAFAQALVRVTLTLPSLYLCQIICISDIY